MKILGISIIAMALVIAIAPQFLDCQSQGRALTLQSGMSIPMKCHWSAIAAFGLAIPLAGVGGLSSFSRRKESRRNLSILGILLGAVVILIPTTLIGVCSGDMLCNTIMKPLLVLAGILVIVFSGLTLLPTLKKGADAEE
jgi:hypothetical protein